MPEILAFLGQKRIIFSTILALALIGGVVWFVSKNSKTKTADQPKVAATSLSKAIAEAPDTDNDGLKDWEEKLWGTDPNNPDTDADGTPDNEEIKLGRNPLKPAPNDLLTEKDLAKKQTEKDEFLEENGSDQTLTSKIARDFFTEFMRLKREGFDDEYIQNFLYDELFSDLSSQKVFENESFSPSKAIVSAQNSPSDIKKYVNSLALILETEFGGIAERENTQTPAILHEMAELLILTNFLNEGAEFGNYEKLAVFKEFETAYQNSAGKIAQLAVPSNYLNLHIELINAFRALAKISRAFGNFGADPLSGLVVLENYQKEHAVLKNTVLNLALKLLANGIKLTPAENGYLFVTLDQLNNIQLNAI